MLIQWEDSFLQYQREKGFDAVTVTAASSGGSCCRIVVPKVRSGAPKQDLEKYWIQESQGVTFYISRNLQLQPVVTFSHERLLGRDRMDMKGFVIRHASQP